MDSSLKGNCRGSRGQQCRSDGSIDCTCCAAPVVVGLRARQASPGGAIAFWFGNTILNPAALAFMGFVLGWNWTALRLLLGILMVFGACLSGCLT
jgi:uncharacterized membrane protein YraQ (UPF0718 family)